MQILNVVFVGKIQFDNLAVVMESQLFGSPRKLKNPILK